MSRWHSQPFSHLLQRDEVTLLVIQRQEAGLKFLESRFRIEVCEEIGMQPLRHLLYRDELVGVVVELMPDGMHIAVGNGLDAGEGRTLCQSLKLAAGFLE